MAMMNGAVGQKYNLGPVKPWVEFAAYFIGNRHGVKNIGGWRASDPFPDHPSGHALDYMISSNAQGDAIAQDVINNAQFLGVKYLIWNRRTWSPDKGWQPYTSTSNPHTDHVHVTYNDSPGTGSGGTATPIGTSPVSKTDSTCAWSVSLPLKGDSCVLSKVQARTLFSLVLVGGSLVVGIAGVLILVAYGLQRPEVAGNVPGAGKLAARMTA